jgi:predicted nucleic acid-binding protein
MILDTNALSDFFAGHANIGPIIEKESVLYLPVIVLGEYRFGLLGSKKAKEITPRLNALAASAHILNVDAETTLHYAELRHQLKMAGTPIPENDVWIAALCRQHRLPLLSRDGHFDNVQGLTRVGW